MPSIESFSPMTKMKYQQIPGNDEPKMQYGHKDVRNRKQNLLFKISRGPKQKKKKKKKENKDKVN